MSEFADADVVSTFSHTPFPALVRAPGKELRSRWKPGATPPPGVRVRTRPAPGRPA